MSLSCLANIIGLTLKDCGCHDGTKPQDFESLNASDSGYYITDDDYGFSLLSSVMASMDCGDGDTIWDILVEARRLAINAFDIDVQMAINQKHVSSIISFNGEIGQRNGTSSQVNLLNPYAGWQMRPGRLRGGFFKITAIWAGFQQSGTVDLKFLSNNPDFSQADITLNTVGGKFEKNDRSSDPITIPFHSSGYLDQLRYAFYTQPGANLPLSNTIDCGCGERPMWRNQVAAGGFQVNDPADSITANYNGTAANGIVLEGHFGCDTTDWICNASTLAGFPLREVAARTIQFKAAANLAQFVLDSENINFYTSLRREVIYGKRNAAIKNYMSNIDWIASKLPANASECYKCRNEYVTFRSF